MRVLAIAGILLTLNISAQKDASWDFEGAALGGFLMPHHADMLYLVDGHVVGGELSMTKRTAGEKDWHPHYLFPRWGITLNGYKLGSESMGTALAGRIFFDLPTGKSRTFWMKLSIGAGWVERPFDIEDNVHNSAIGSHLNASLAVEAHLNLNLGEKIVFKPGIGIHHYSNGAMQMPNSGINLAMLRLAFMYRTKQTEIPTMERKPVEKTPGQVSIGVSGGAKEIKPIGGRTYAILNGFAIWQKRLSPKSSFGGEIGLNYNESLQYRSENLNGEDLDPGNNYRAYIAALYQLHFDPLALRFGLGTYINPSFTDDGSVFFRYHLVYQLERFQVFTGLKSHYAKADNIELGMAYRLK